MNKKAYFISVGCFILGLVLGVGVTWRVGSHFVAKGYFATKLNELVEAKQEADEAYYHGSKSWAIYALSHYLAELKEAQELGLGQMPESFKNPWTDKLGISTGLVMTHGRLADLYGAVGQTNQSAQQVAEALKCAKDSGGRFLWVTNRAKLAEFDAAFGGISSTPPNK